MAPDLLRLRARIDEIDNTIHNLLMERAGMVMDIAEAKRKAGVQVVQPDREAVMIRRLLARHKGPLPAQAVVRIWRELVGAVSMLQTGLKVCVVSDPKWPDLWDMARDYFGSTLPAQKTGNATSAISLVSEKDASFAVLPWPEDSDNNPWWQHLNEQGDDALRIAMRLPHGRKKEEQLDPENMGLVVAQLKFQESGEDRSFLILETPQDVSRARLNDLMKAANLKPRTIHSRATLNGMTGLYLLEVEGFYNDSGHPDLKAFLGKLEHGATLRCVGGYPVPPLY